MFTINHDEALDMGLVDEGEYEVIVTKAFEDATKNGAVFMNLHLQIRNDIDQPNKNRYIFGSIWQSKDTGQYHPGMVNTVARALNIPNGKQYKTVDELLEDFKLKIARVTVKHEEYNGNTNARVQFWEPTKYPTCNHQFKVSDIPTGFSETSNDNIPF